MTKWLRKIAQTNDLAYVGEAILYYEELYEEYRKKLNVKGEVIIKVGAEIPDLTDKVYAFWMEIKAIAEIVELRRAASLGKSRKNFIEVYNRVLTSQQVEKYAEVDIDVIAFSELLIEIDFIKNKWEGLSKAVERLHHQIRIISEMRKGGIEDATI